MNADGGVPGPGPSPAEGAAAEDLERVVARLLTIGTYGSVAVLAIGSAMMLTAGVQPLAAWTPFDPARVGDDLIHLRPAGVIWIGLVAVVATPASRVAASLVGYLRRGERSMALIAGLILAVIALSIALVSRLPA
jgi:uncharacterized membrane protein